MHIRQAEMDQHKREWELMCWSRTLKLCQPADSHWLDNVSPSFPPSSHPSLLCNISLSLTISLASAFTHSLIQPPTQRFHPRVSILHQSAVSGPVLSTEQQHQALPCLCLCQPVYPNASLHQEPLPCID